MSVKQNLFVSVFVHKCLMMLNDAEYTAFKMFVTQMSNYLFVISFQLMFYKTSCYRLARASLSSAIDYKIASLTGIVINCSVSSRCNDRSNHWRHVSILVSSGTANLHQRAWLNYNAMFYKTSIEKK